MKNPTTPRDRLFSHKKLVANSELWLNDEQAKYVTRVLRLKVDHKVVMFDGKGGEYVASIIRFVKNRVLLHVGDRHTRKTESPLAIRLIQGISRNRRMDIVIQKSTELGVRRITPVITEFSIVKLDAERAAKRHEHWLKISQSACEQCGRIMPPEIDMPQKLDGWLTDFSSADVTRIMLDPDSSKSIAMLPAPNINIELLIGPEGGFSEAEYVQCKEANFKAIALGPRILRTETAALASISILQAFWGDLS